MELSNLCPYSTRHARCPASRQTEKHILPARIVYDVIDTLRRHRNGLRLRKGVAFHGYSEPLIDPRLMEFVRHTRKQLPKAPIIIWTNGWYLTETIVDELVEAGATVFFATTYNKGDGERYKSLSARVPSEVGGLRTAWTVVTKPLDDRINWKPHKNWKPCNAPLMDMRVYPTGKIGLCCQDVWQQVTFADLNDMSFEEALEKDYPRMLALHDELVKGNRTLDPCIRCPKKR